MEKIDAVYSGMIWLLLGILLFTLSLIAIIQGQFVFLLGLFISGLVT